MPATQQPFYRRGGYHGLRPRWRDARDLKGKLVGIELEVGHESGYRRLLDLLPRPRRGQNLPITETDGSLNQTTSAEIVFPPYRYGDVKRGKSFLNKAMKALKDGGATHDANGGMHMNLNTTGWSGRKIQYFVALVQALPRKWTENLGGRPTNMYCSRVIRTLPEEYTTYSTERSMVEIKAGRIECRFPKATVDSDRVANLLVFFEYVERAVGNEARRRELRALFTAYPNGPTENNGYDFRLNFRIAVGQWFESVVDSVSIPGREAMKEVMLNGYR